MIVNEPACRSVPDLRPDRGVYLRRRLCHAAHPPAGVGGEQTMGHRGRAGGLLRRGPVHPRHHRREHRHLCGPRSGGHRRGGGGYPRAGVPVPGDHYGDRRLPAKLHAPGVCGTRLQRRPGGGGRAHHVQRHQAVQKRRHRLAHPDHLRRGAGAGGVRHLLLPAPGGAGDGVGLCDVPGVSGDRRGRGGPVRPRREGRAQVMVLVQLFLEFCRVGLFSVGGGLATIPFLTDLGERTGWFGAGDLANMIAISESTPGPMGVNMATYVGFHTAGVVGGVVATVGLIFPSVVIILIIAGFLEKFRQSKAVDAVFYGLRAASVALITAALLQVAKIALLTPGQPFQLNLVAVILAVIVFVLVKFSPLKKLHPVCFIGLAALAGIVFQM